MEKITIKNPSLFGNRLHKKGFRVWAIYMFKLIEGREFIEEPLHADLFQAFQDIFDQKVIRQILNLPPRSAKTSLTKYFIAYSLAHDNRCNFIYTSYSQVLLKEISKDLAKLLQHSIYQAMYPISCQVKEFESKPVDDFWKEYLEKTQNKAVFTNSKIITSAGGTTLFASIGSAITGFGAGIRGAKGFSGSLIIDDGNKPADINSQTMRHKAFKYYQGTLLSRLNDSLVSIINIQQRLHLQDLSGLLKKIYKFVTLKCALVINGVCQLPSQYTLERLQELQKNEYEWVSQYQQEPIMAGGNLFKVETIKEVKRENLPTDDEYDYRFVTGDLSYKDKQSNDPTVFCYWGVKIINKRVYLYLIDVKRKRINSVEVEGWITPWIDRKRTYGFRYIWIEDKGHGIYLNQLYRRAGFPIPDEKMLKDILPRDTDKTTRANNIIPCLDAVNPNLIFCSDIENYSDLTEELFAFPNGDNDDFVDNVIDAIKIGLFKKRKVSIFDTL